MRLDRNIGTAPLNGQAPGGKHPQALRQRGDGVKRAGAKPDLQAEKARIKQVAREFEALMLEKMMHQMRASIPEDKLMGGGRGKEIFEEMLDGEYAKHMTHQGGLGLGSFLTRSLEARQFGQNARPGAGRQNVSHPASPNPESPFGRSSSKGIDR